MAAIWERQPDESVKAFHAFTLYRDLPPNERSMKKVAEMLGVSEQNLSKWSPPSKFNWVERVLAYDSFIDTSKIELRQADIETAQQATLAQEGAEIAALSYIVQQSLNLLRAQKGMDMLELTRAVSLIEKVQSMRRRNVGLPSTYITKSVEEIHNEAPVFLARPDEPARLGDGDEIQDDV